MLGFNLLKYSAKTFRLARRLYFMETEHHTTYSITTNIDLSETERDIFNIFSSFVKEKNLGTTIRVAGGWVRDKVLGRESSDIDFALDNMMGEQFVTQAHAYLKEKMDVRGFGVTRLNPEQSKHLETATIQVKGIWIDVVNLRGETYGQDSRIPIIDIGTPEQDAFRRDLTINSLFYNVNTGKIEDFTNKGLQDLENGIARTPLPPDQTFIDDPLRILRAIRFIARFDLKMDESMSNSLKKPDIVLGLKKKVSKERIGTELKLQLSHPGAFQSITMFHQYGLFPYMIEIPATCFELAPKTELINELFERSFRLCEIANKFFVEKEAVQFTETIKNFFPLADLRFYVYLAMIMEPFAPYKVEINPKSKKTEPLVLNLVKGAVKFTNNDAEITSLAASTKEKFQKLCKNLLEEKNILLDTAKVIKDMGQWAKTWELGFILALVADISQHNGDPQQVIAAYEKLYKYIYENNLNQLFNLKPLLDGGQIQQIFEAKGPIISIIKDNVFYWQIEHPDKSVDDLKAFIENNKDQFLKNHFE